MKPLRYMPYAFVCMSPVVFNTTAFAGYNEDIAPIMRDKCVSCHNTQAPLLTTEAEVKAAIMEIVSTISVDANGPEKAKLMPKGGPSLDPASINKIKAWQSLESSDATATAADPAATTPDAPDPTATATPETDTATATDPGVTPGSDVQSPGVEDGKPTPLIVDLSGKGTFSFAASPVAFDIRGAGERLVSWPAATSAFVTLDLNKNGTIDSGRELFGDGTLLTTTGVAAKNGFEALAQHDLNRDGAIDVSDPIFQHLSIWHDQNSNGVTDKNELKPLSATGITSLSLAYESHVQMTPSGDEIPLLLSYFVQSQKSGRPTNNVLADIFLVDHGAVNHTKK